MPQAISPNRLQPDTPYADNIAYINDNTDKLISAVNDLGMKRFGGGGSFGGISLAAGAIVSFSVNVVDTKNQYVVNQTVVNPQWQLFIDTDNNYNYLIPNGSLVTDAMKNLQFNWWQTTTVPTGSPADTKAVVYGIMKNNDSVSHVYYLYTEIFLIDSPVSGIFR